MGVSGVASSIRCRLDVVAFFLPLAPPKAELLLSVRCGGWFWVYLVTVETPSTNLVLKRTLALLNIPSFSETTINCK